MIAQRQEGGVVRIEIYIQADGIQEFQRVADRLGSDHEVYDLAEGLH